MIIKRLKLRRNIVESFLATVRKYKKTDLIEKLNLIHKTEVGIKSGKIAPANLEILISELTLQ